MKQNYFINRKAKAEPEIKLGAAVLRALKAEATQFE